MKRIMYNFNMRVVKFSLIFSFILLVLALAVVFPTAQISAQAPDRIYISETGHWIEGKFLEMYRSTDTPELIFGYPLTDEITNPETGAVMQYFQRARMDLIESVGGPVIQLANLGTFLYTPGTPSDGNYTNSASCRFFPQTGKPVCYAFLEFYQQHQGDIFFGNPISGVEEQDGRWVQYFERARLEWSAAGGAGQWVTLTDLGRIYFDTFGYALSAADTQISAQIAGELVHPQVHAFVEKALVQGNANQTLFIVVQDQRLQPVEGAMVMVVITWPDQTQSLFRSPMTDANGISKLEFAVADLAPKEIIKVDVTASYQDNSDQASTWFRIWW